MPSFNYEDIIDLPYPREDWNFRMKHPRMSLEARAKIFAPFAALRGHSDAIDDTARRRQNIKREDLLEDGISELEDSLIALLSALNAGEHPEVEITYFRQSNVSPDSTGKYKTLTGQIKKMDLFTQTLTMTTLSEDVSISFSDIKNLENIL